MTTQTQKTQAAMTPQDALARLQEGHARFRARTPLPRDLLRQARRTAAGQYPFAAVLGCIDARVPPELIFDQGLGDIFCLRIAGNVLTGDVLGNLEFACNVAGARLILVLGHTNCGAVTGALQGLQMGHLTAALDPLRPAIQAVAAAGGDSGLLSEARERGTPAETLVNRVARQNVRLALRAIPQRSPHLQRLVDQGKVGLAGAMYDVHSAEVHFLD